MKRPRKPGAGVGYWFGSIAATLHGKVIAQIWKYGERRKALRCRSKQTTWGPRCMWEAGHPDARHMSFLSDEAWPGGPPQSIEWGDNPNPRGTKAGLRRSIARRTRATPRKTGP